MKKLLFVCLIFVGCVGEPQPSKPIAPAVAEKAHKAQAWEAVKSAMRRTHAPDRVTFGEWEATETHDGGVLIVVIVATCTVETGEGAVIQHKFRCASDRTSAGHWGFGRLKYLETKTLFVPRRAMTEV